MARIANPGVTMRNYDDYTDVARLSDESREALKRRISEHGRRAELHRQLKVRAAPLDRELVPVRLQISEAIVAYIREAERIP